MGRRPVLCEQPARALLAAGIMVAPQLSATQIVLLSPDHTGTAVPVLVKIDRLDGSLSEVSLDSVPFSQAPLIVGTAISKNNNTTFMVNASGVYRVSYVLRTAVSSLMARPLLMKFGAAARGRHVRVP